MRDSDYVLPSSDSESARLEAQASLYGGTSFLEEAVAARPGAVLDVGCGTGFFARWVAEQLPAARVVGVDQDEERLAWARERAPGLELHRADMTRLPFEDASFDLVYARMALLHQPDLDPVLGELSRVTRPGGTVLAFEMVHDGIWLSPPRPAFEQVLREVLALLASHGIEPDQGLHVPGAMVRAGLGEVRCRVVPFALMPHDPEFSRWMRNWVLTVTSLEDILGASLDRELIERAVAELRDDRADQLLVETTLLAWGTR